MQNLILYISCTLLGSFGAWIIIKWGASFGLLDKVSARSSHKGVVPRGGGIGILAAFVLASIVLKIPVGLWASATVLSLVTLFDDRFELSPKFRLAVQFMAVFAFLLSVYYFPSSILPATVLHILILFIFSVIFIVGTTNYYNFMDGINGIAGITGIVVFSLIASFTILSGGHNSILILTISIALACLGFLPFNIPRARVFMGDTGSILLGFVYAGLVVGLTSSLNDFVVLCAFLFPFYADELTTMYILLRDGKSLLKPHRKHLYQLLANEKGIDHWKVSLGYGVLQVVVGIGVLILRGYGTIVLLTFLAIFFVGFSVVSYTTRSKL